MEVVTALGDAHDFVLLVVLRRRKKGVRGKVRKERPRKGVSRHEKERTDLFETDCAVRFDLSWRAVFVYAARERLFELGGEVSGLCVPDAGGQAQKPLVGDVHVIVILVITNKYGGKEGRERRGTVYHVVRIKHASAVPLIRCRGRRWRASGVENPERADALESALEPSGRRGRDLGDGRKGVVAADEGKAAGRVDAER